MNGQKGKGKGMIHILVKKKVQCPDGDLFLCMTATGKEMLYTPEKLLPYAQNGVADGVSVVHGAGGSTFLRVNRGTPVIKSTKSVFELTGSKPVVTQVHHKEPVTAAPAKTASDKEHEELVRAHRLAFGMPDASAGLPKTRKTYAPDRYKQAHKMPEKKPIKNVEAELLEKIWTGIQKAMQDSDHAGCTYFTMQSNDKQNRWAICFGWQDGYDPDENGSEDRFCGKVAYQTKNNIMQCDFDFDWMMPCSSDGDVDDTCLEIGSKDDVKWLLEQWKRIRKERKI